MRVRLGAGWQDVTLARSPWVVDQLWWREQPVQRIYFRLDPADLPPITVYFDFNHGVWERQEY